MHPHLDEAAHPACAEAMRALRDCHASAGASRFWGACNDPDAALARCLKAERLQKRADNYALARKRGAVTLAKAKAKAKDDEASR